MSAPPEADRSANSPGGLEYGVSFQLPLHQPVMLREVLEWLRPGSGKIIADCTLGTGGHAVAILKEIGPSGLLVGLDRDSEVIEVAKGFLSQVSNPFRLFHADYADLGQILQELGIEGVDGLLLDLGVSSYQLGIPERGFSFQLEGPLDMRMDRTSGLTAAEMLRRLKEEELARIFWEYGEERWSRRIARAIKAHLRKATLDTTTQLASLIERVVPGRRGRIHPATRVFQALRIAVNRELQGLEVFLSTAYKFLKPGARMVVISFHSLEDRIVKRAFMEGFKKGLYMLLTRKPIRPSQEEVSKNPRSRSAKLRTVERL
ncbi:MAG TPA: 16S rRNA (cytosine(1402)-N(4))-methyltransferase RsmH [Candidatus Hypogeohydataceae bacterium YC41]